MSVENIRRIMRDGVYFENRLSEWDKYLESTNCYAFALGIKAEEDDIGDIGDHAFWCGHIANLVIGTETDDYADNVERVERQILNDFQALGMNYQVFQDANKYQYLKELEHSSDSWDILLFINPETLDYHFARVGRDGILYHKPGWGYAPRATSIAHIETTKFIFTTTGPIFKKRYRVSL